MRIEQASAKLGNEERIHALETWYRISEDDGTTIAYVPDKGTAEKIAYLLK